MSNKLRKILKHDYQTPGVSRGISSVSSRNQFETIPDTSSNQSVMKKPSDLSLPDINEPLQQAKYNISNQRTNNPNTLNSSLRSGFSKHYII